MNSASATPDDQDPSAPEPAKRTDVGYKRPPVEHQFQPGNRANPLGRPTAGASIREWINELVSRDVPVATLRKIVKDESEPPRKIIAAGRILIALERGNLKDFEPFLKGDKTLEELNAAGINTDVVKKAKISAKGDRELELHDRSGGEVDRLINQTEPTPAELEKNKRLDEGKATDIVQYQQPTIHEPAARLPEGHG